jgi:hypothetical protein
MRSYRAKRPYTCAAVFLSFTILPVLIIWILWEYTFAIPSCPSIFLNPSDSAHQLILNAGKTDDEVERHGYLVALKETGKDIEDLEKLISTAHRYAYPDDEPYVEEMRIKSLEKLSETGYLVRREQRKEMGRIVLLSPEQTTIKTTTRTVTRTITATHYTALTQYTFALRNG